MKVKTNKTQLVKALFEIFQCGYKAALDDINQVMINADYFDESDYYTITQSFEVLLDNDIDTVILALKKEGIL